MKCRICGVGEVKLVTKFGHKLYFKGIGYYSKIYYSECISGCGSKYFSITDNRLNNKEYEYAGEYIRSIYTEGPVLYIE